MIRKINKNEEKLIIGFLTKFAPEQIQFIKGDYFEHGENIVFGFLKKRYLLAALDIVSKK